jgi:hypothetical protein
MKNDEFGFQRSKDITYWNRRLHIHLGLFLLLFLWLFSFSGLLLNHRNWEAFKFWEQREETRTVVPISIPEGRETDAVLKSVISQLKIAGEITNVKTWADSVHFSVAYPGHIRNLQVDFKSAICTQKEIKLNWSGKIQALHTFNGTNKRKADPQTNWLITKIWRISMDGIAIGLILLCASSWVMWYRMKENYPWSWAILISGFAAAGYFVFAIGML